MINYNNHNITAITYDNHSIKYVYGCGGSLVWSGDTPTPPTGDYRVRIRKTNSTSATSYCDNSLYGNNPYVTQQELHSLLPEIGSSNWYDYITDISFGTCPNLIGIGSNFLPGSENHTITSVTFDNSSISSIGISAFNNARGLTTLRIPVNITTIGNSAFYECDGLTSVTIDSGTTSIGGGAFMFCSGLTAVYIYNPTPPTLGSYAFMFTNDCPIYVPCGSVSAYKAATNWSEYANRIVGIPPCSETLYRWVDIDPSVDYYCSGMAKQYKQKKQQSEDDGETWTDVSPAEYQRGDYVEYVSSDCGYDNTGRINFIEDMSTNSSTTNCVTAFTLVNSYNKMYDFDIASDTVCGLRGINGSTVVRKVRSVVFPNNTRTIDTYAFYKNNSYDTSKKKLILFNEGLETIGDYAFDEFTGGDVDDTMFNVLVIPSTVTSIGHEAFNFDGRAFSSGPSSQWLNIYFKGTTPPTFASDIFGGIGETQMNKQIVLYVPQGTLQAYTDALPSNYKISSNPMSIVEYTESSSIYDLDMYSLKSQLRNQGFLS